MSVRLSVAQCAGLVTHLHVQRTTPRQDACSTVHFKALAATYRPHPIEKIKDEEGAQEVDTRSGWQGSDCRNNAHKVMIILNTIQKNILMHKFRIRVKRQVLSCSIPAATRASLRMTTKKRA